VGALLGALRASGDDTLLAEAREKFPDDPRVQFAAAFKSDSPQEQREWLEKFKASAPDNALASYLLAGGHFKSGETEQALRELAAATAKPAFENYLVDFIQNAEEAYHASGYPIADAKAAAGMGALLPELAQLKSAGVGLAELAKKYQQAGDDASARAALDMAMTLGHRLDQTPQITLIQELVGMAIERIALNGMNPNSPYGQSGQTVQDQIDALAARRKAIRTLTSESAPILMSLSDEDTVHYFDRSRMYGEVAALRWVMNQAPQP
jgi:lipopolysaccharide biosynthesis regulator YciM